MVNVNNGTRRRSQSGQSPSREVPAKRGRAAAGEYFTGWPFDGAIETDEPPFKVGHVTIQFKSAAVANGLPSKLWETVWKFRKTDQELKDEMPPSENVSEPHKCDYFYATRIPA